MLDRTPLTQDETLNALDYPIARHDTLFWNPVVIDFNGYSERPHRPLPNGPAVLYNPRTLDIYSSKATTRYTPANYQELWTQIVEMCQLAGLDPATAQITVQKGRNHYGTDGSSVRVDLTWYDERIKADPHVDDYIALRMTFLASYDLSWSIQLKFSGLRLWCTNGCYHSDFAIRAVERHTGDIEIGKYQNVITNARERFASSENMYQDMARKPILFDHAMDVLSKLAQVSTPPRKRHHRYPSHSVHTIHTLEDLLRDYFGQIGHTKWAAYNAATEWATHFKTKGQYVKQHTAREAQVARLFNTKEWAEL